MKPSFIRKEIQQVIIIEMIKKPSALGNTSIKISRQKFVRHEVCTGKDRAFFSQFYGMYSRKVQPTSCDRYLDEVDGLFSMRSSTSISIMNILCSTEKTNLHFYFWVEFELEKFTIVKDVNKLIHDWPLACFCTLLISAQLFWFLRLFVLFIHCSS